MSARPAEFDKAAVSFLGVSMECVGDASPASKGHLRFPEVEGHGVRQSFDTEQVQSAQKIGYLVRAHRRDQRPDVELPGMRDIEEPGIQKPSDFTNRELLPSPIEMNSIPSRHR